LHSKPPNMSGIKSADSVLRARAVPGVEGVWASNP
jgi:hypothetical protein